MVLYLRMSIRDPQWTLLLTPNSNIPFNWKSLASHLFKQYNYNSKWCSLTNNSKFPRGQNHQVLRYFAHWCAVFPLNHQTNSIVLISFMISISTNNINHLSVTQLSATTVLNSILSNGSDVRWSTVNIRSLSLFHNSLKNLILLVAIRLLSKYCCVPK